MGALHRNVAKAVKFTTVDRDQHSPSVKDVKRLIEASAGTELEPIIGIAIGTGLRRREICGLRWGDVDFDEGTISVRRSAANLNKKVVIKRPKAKKSARTDVPPTSSSTFSGAIGTSSCGATIILVSRTKVPKVMSSTGLAMCGTRISCRDNSRGLSAARSYRSSGFTTCATATLRLRSSRGSP